MTMLDWTLLRSFLAVVDAGSLSAAADRLGLVQPTVGRHIRELEETLDTPLFRRQPRGLEPTPAALDLIEDARRMGEAALALERKASGTGDSLAGTVRVTASRMVATYLLPGIVAALHVDEPDVDIEIVASDETQNLLRRDADIALRMYEPRQPQLIRRRIGDLPLAVYASPAYLARRGTPTRLVDLLEHDIIGLDRADDLLQGFARAGLPVPREWFPIRCDDHVVGWQMVIAGAGIGFVQVPIADAEPRVVRLPVEDIGFALPLWLAYHEDLKPSRRIRFVADRLAEGLARRIKPRKAK
ncbi:LysR family transcriptional regulator [Pleomorphomonas sp. NRK KF1]|uniref:LysR family transcriptional regulator n=1 Tax=Pleomorphomonas sp. NRK KF1 TaxID=2943000 RepID=UPI002043FF1D|nr:LysR family transcriptional regulator [Pleomorphomonas sp. NRK KF1]MCM5555586.1 LysR family transcriptional regulator [Pleomorphomonas sp. NRK KF1]